LLTIILNPKKAVPVPSNSTDNINQVATTNPEPEKGRSTIKDALLGISFDAINNAVAVKGSARCCPTAYEFSVPGAINNPETMDIFVPGTSDDPRKGWVMASFLGEKTYGANTFNAYKITDSDGTVSYIFSIIKDSKGFNITSPYSTPHYIDLSSLAIK
jgi:hypothetical protein